MKHIRTYVHSLFAVLLAAIAAAGTVSCTSEIPEIEKQGIQVIRMRLEGGLQEFDAAATRATSSLPNGAKLLIRFDGGAYGTGVYSAETGEWEFTKTGGSLSSTSSASCTLYYAPSPKSESSNAITLDYDTPLYMAQGEYSYSSSILTIKATLLPATARVRFRGTTGTTISLSGLTYYTGVDVSKSSPLSSTASSISFTVNDTYSGYIYGYFADSNHELELTTNNITYKRTIESNLFENGKGGYIDIPTSSALGKWKDVTTHEYVDLGLSVMWATCNVGALSPEEYGDYYAWGETETKSVYDWSTYKWCNGSSYTMTKYCTSSSYGTVDNKTQLELSDDVAHVKWGGTWRMPTKAEQDELRENCTWKWTTQGGKNGYLVTSKANRNSIFLPAAGTHGRSDFYSVGSYGNYWSSSLCEDNSDNSYKLAYSSGYWKTDQYYRSNGQSVRAVCINPSFVRVTSITLNRSGLEISTGETFQLKATVSPSNATNKNVTWSSSNDAVATVSSTGLVTAVAIGSATITAAAADGSGKIATCSVTVKSGNSIDMEDYGEDINWH